jgi:hypothetical protein
MSKETVKRSEKATLSHARDLMKQYEELSFTFEEGKQFKKFVGDAVESFKEARKLTEGVRTGREEINWEKYNEMEIKLKQLQLNFEEEESEVWKGLKEHQMNSILKTYREYIGYMNKHFPEK